MRNRILTCVQDSAENFNAILKEENLLKNIEEVVISFLEKYKSPQIIEDLLNKFKKEFPIIVETLNLRIESEESGVYSYWGLF